MNRLGAKGVPFVFVIDFEMERPVVLPETEARPNGILYSFNSASNAGSGTAGQRPFRFGAQPVPYDEYRTSFGIVAAHILNGDSYLVNLTFPTLLDTDLTLEEIFFRSSAPYRLLMEDRFVVFSPEAFVRIHDGLISTFPMKGTIDASVPHAEEKLLGDPKEIAEHNTIVDLLRNDLGIAARDIHVNRFRYIDKLKTNFRDLLQVSSEITGVLGSAYPRVIGDIIFGMLPAGSVSGAPKKRTTEIIREAERAPRGYYTGVMGRFDGKDLDSGVMIRFIEKNDRGMFFRSGGGITCFSDPLTEYDEMVKKVYVPFA